MIFGLTKTEGYCFATNEWIGKNLGMSGSMVSKHISSLVKKGKMRVEVTKVKKSEGTPNEWGTRRKIYIFCQQDSNGLSINGEPPSTINGEYIVKNREYSGSRGLTTTTTKSSSFSNKNVCTNTMDEFWKDFRTLLDENDGEFRQIVYDTIAEITDGEYGQNVRVTREMRTALVDKFMTFNLGKKLTKEKCKAYFLKFVKTEDYSRLYDLVEG